MQYKLLNPIRRGGQYCPPNLWEALKQKLFESVIYNFLTIPKYVYTLTSNKKMSFVPWSACREGFQIGQSRYVVHSFDISKFFSEYYSYSIMLGVYIYLILVTDFIFGVKKIEALWLLSYLELNFGHVILWRARRSACALF